MKSNRTRPTERRNARTRGLDAKSSAEIVRAIHREDAAVHRAIAPALPAIARAVDVMVLALRNRGRIFYIGAGTSGRLATLDAAELPPTFGMPASAVQAIIAGGNRALTHASEGAEDDAAQGRRDLAARKLRARDVVVGIAASGATPYVLGGLAYAKRVGAVTVGISCNPGSPLTKAATISIVAATGPEVITGSTRMKAGTAQKMILNMLSTASMVRMGRVYDNRMICVALTNRKLRARGLRLLMEASGAPLAESTRALRQSGHDTGLALVMLKAGISAREARRRLRAARGNIRETVSTQA
jgi:N-acetylmuramic acid 6-phosphate etherase